MNENTEKLSYVKINLYEIKILLALTRSTQKRNKIKSHSAATNKIKCFQQASELSAAEVWYAEPMVNSSNDVSQQQQNFCRENVVCAWNSGCMTMKTESSTNTCA